MCKKTMKKLLGLKNRASWSWGRSWPRPVRQQVIQSVPSRLLPFEARFICGNDYIMFKVKYLVYMNLNLPSTELGGLLKFVRPFLISISKAKAARLVRSLLDLFLDMEAATGQEVELCLECIEWAKAEKRTFLRQALEVSSP